MKLTNLSQGNGKKLNRIATNKNGVNDDGDAAPYGEE